MTPNDQKRILLTSFLLVILMVLAGCGGSKTPTSNPPTLTTETLTSPSAVPPATLEPSVTPVPPAAMVNGTEITLAEYQAELGRYQAALGKAGTDLATDEKQKVLDDLIDETLLSQGAAQAGYSLDEAGLQSRIDALVNQLGSQQALQDWMSAHGYDEASFRQALSRSAAAAWMRDQIAASVPEKVEQVHVRQILVYNADQAQQILGQIEAGSDFENLAWKYDPTAGGDLGWFPQGYLTEPALEQAAFKLQPGEHSGIIETQLGFHILLMIERDPQHPLDPNARLALQERALEQWLQTERSKGRIQVLLP